jgi:hypothetical protein
MFTEPAPIPQPPHPDLLSPDDLGDLVDKGLELSAEISNATTRLKQIEAKIKAHALACPEAHQPLADKDREGTQYLAKAGRYNLSARVVCTADLLIQSFAAGSDTHHKISAASTAAGVTVADFYRLSRTWELRAKSGKAFRQLARESADDPERLITACIRRDKDGVPVSQVKVEWGME